MKLSLVQILVEVAIIQFGLQAILCRLYLEDRSGEEFHPSGAHGWVSRSLTKGEILTMVKGKQVNIPVL